MSCVILCDDVAGVNLCYKQLGDLLDYETLVGIYNVLVCNHNKFDEYANATSVTT